MKSTKTAIFVVIAVLLVLTATTTAFAANSPTATGTIVLPTGTVYYTMVDGQPGASHTLSQATTATVIEKLGNGYTKVLIGTTTYLISDSSLSEKPRPSTTTSGKSPKTGESDLPQYLIITLCAAGVASVICARKVLKAGK